MRGGSLFSKIARIFCSSWASLGQHVPGNLFAQQHALLSARQLDGQNNSCVLGDSSAAAPSRQWPSTRQMLLLLFVLLGVNSVVSLLLRLFCVPLLVDGR